MHVIYYRHKWEQTGLRLGSSCGQNIFRSNTD